MNLKINAVSKVAIISEILGYFLFIFKKSKISFSLFLKLILNFMKDLIELEMN